MKKLMVGNGPCSWGTLEFDDVKTGEQIPFGQMLDELAEAGYTATELGDWGYMPTEPAALREEMKRRGLAMLAAFVPVALKYESAHAAGVAEAVKTAKLLAAVAIDPAPYLVLADANGTDPLRTRIAGRVRPQDGLSAAEWKIFAGGADRVARAVFEETGLRTLFHHHCAGFVETPDEIATLLSLTNPARLGLVFDTGHYCFGAGGCDAVAGMERFRERVGYMHLKDCQPEVAAQSRREEWEYFTSLRRGVFCELGKGCVDFAAVLARLDAMGYDGYVLVEQDVLPGMGTPKESARRNREYLRGLENV